jgi:pyruvate dehydrogenase E1 component
MSTTLLNGQPVEAVYPDMQEVDEWLEAFDQVVDEEGPSGAARLLDALTRRAQQAGVDVPVQLNTPYVNTIPVSEEHPYPGDRLLERRLKSLIRWNAMAMVHRQNKKDPGIGGHISTYSSLATLLEVGFNHFFHANYGDQPVTLFTFRATLRPAFMLVHSWRGDSRRPRSRTSAMSCATPRDFRHIRIPG